ncbi:hypothetical protein DRN93_03630 [archaeon]|nr:MAG: hypothetical protein DRN93_03630 [archaeon]
MAIAVVGLSRKDVERLNSKLASRGIALEAYSTIFELIDKRSNRITSIVLGLHSEGDEDLKVAYIAQDGKAAVSSLDQLHSLVEEEPNRGEELKSLAQNFINQVLNSAEEVLGSMAGIEAASKEIIEEGEEPPVDISGVMSLSNLREGEHDLKGSIAISMPMEIAKLIVSQMLMLEDEEVDIEEVKDGIGEIVNMTLGDVKFKTNKKFELSIPTVIVGPAHEIWSKDKNTTARGTLEIPNSGRMLMKVFLKEQKEGENENFDS